jgi:hypothetical protein
MIDTVLCILWILRTNYFLKRMLFKDKLRWQIWRSTFFGSNINDIKTVFPQDDYCITSYLIFLSKGLHKYNLAISGSANA